MGCTAACLDLRHGVVCGGGVWSWAGDSILLGAGGSHESGGMLASAWGGGTEGAVVDRLVRADM